MTYYYVKFKKTGNEYIMSQEGRVKFVVINKTKNAMRVDSIFHSPFPVYSHRYDIIKTYINKEEILMDHPELI